MDGFVTTVFVICDDVLRLLQVEDDSQSQMSNAEVMTFSIIAAKYFSMNHRFARVMCKRLKYFPKILSPSRLNRRIRKISWEIWNAVFRFLALIFRGNNPDNSFAVDSFPISCCQKSRIDRRKIFLGKEYIGYSPSKKKHFCGIKVHMDVTGGGKPIETMFRPGSCNDITALWGMELDLPAGAILYADGAYNCFELEDILREDEETFLYAKRGSYTKQRVRRQEEEKRISSKRQVVETAFSCITDLFPRNIRARTERGFLLKIFSAIIAYSISCFTSRLQLTH